MTDDEAQRVLDRLTGAFDKELSAEAADVWIDELVPLDFSPAYSAAREIGRSGKWFPPIGEFLAAYREHQRRQARPQRRALGCGACDQGWVTVRDESPPDVRPCRECRPELAQRHAEGVFLPDFTAASGVDVYEPEPEKHAYLLEEARAALERAQIAKKLAAKAGTTGGAYG